MEMNKLIKTLLATASLGAILALTPISLDFGGHDGLSFKVSQAFADGGNSGSGGGDDNDDSDDSDDDNDDDDNSGSGGSDDDSDDDNNDDDGDSSGRDKPRIPGGSGCDDAGDIAEHPECGGAAGGGTGGQSEFFLADGTKVEISNGGLDIEVKYTDGSKEEIQGGRYERKDTNNNTVEERTATAADVARLQALING